MSLIKRCSQCKKILFKKASPLNMEGAQNLMFCSKCKEKLETQWKNQLEKESEKNKEKFNQKIKGLQKIITPETKIRLNIKGYELQGKYNIEIYHNKKMTREEVIEIIIQASEMLMEQFVGTLMGENTSENNKIIWRTINFKSKLKNKKFDGEEKAETFFDGKTLISTIKQ